MESISRTHKNPALVTQTNTVKIAAGQCPQQTKELWFGIPLKLSRGQDDNGTVRLQWLVKTSGERYAITKGDDPVSLGSILGTIEDVVFHKEGERFITVEDPFPTDLMTEATNSLEKIGQSKPNVEGRRQKVKKRKHEDEAAAAVSSRPSVSNAKQTRASTRGPPRRGLTSGKKRLW